MSAKYPRSFHLPWSPGGTRDDRRMESVDGLCGVPIVITEKLDGSNLTLTREAVFARSHNGPPTHPSFAWAKALHARIRGQLAPGLSVFGEYCYAVHSIEYGELPAYLFLFGVREDDTDTWWEWDLVEAQAEALGLPVAPVLFRGTLADARMLESTARALAAEPSALGGEREGVVVRAARAFTGDEFPRLLGKYVRAGHVQTSEHWMFQEMRVQRGPSGGPR